MHRVGTTPEFGIPEAELGLFVSSVNYTPEFETYEQLDHKGEVCGLVMYKQKVTVELSGEVPLATEGSGTGMKLGAAIELQNSCPVDCWLNGEAPTATTSVLTAAPYTLSREGARERSYTGAIYPFGAES
jgi:hypothetical protein